MSTSMVIELRYRANMEVLGGDVRWKTTPRKLVKEEDTPRILEAIKNGWNTDVQYAVTQRGGWIYMILIWK